MNFKYKPWYKLKSSHTSEGQSQVRLPLRRGALPLLHVQGQRRAGAAPLPAEAAAASAASRIPGTVGTGERLNGTLTSFGKLRINDDSRFI